MAELQLQIGGMELNFSEDGKEINVGDKGTIPLEVELAPDLQHLREQLAQADSKEDIIATLKANGINTMRIEEEMNNNRMVIQETELGTTIFFDDNSDKKFTFEGPLPEKYKEMLKDVRVQTPEQIQAILEQAGVEKSETEVRDDDKGNVHEATEHADKAVMEARYGAKRERGNEGMDR